MGLWGKRDDMIIYEADPYNAETTRAALADRLLTPVDAFYGRNHGPIPEIDPGSWRLTVDGLVTQQLKLSLADLMTGYQHRTLTATLQCAWQPAGRPDRGQGHSRRGSLGAGRDLDGGVDRRQPGRRA